MLLDSVNDPWSAFAWLTSVNDPWSAFAWVVAVTLLSYFQYRLQRSARRAIEDATTRVAQVQGQFENNGGSTMRDAIDKGFKDVNDRIDREARARRADTQKVTNRIDAVRDDLTAEQERLTQHIDGK